MFKYRATKTSLLIAVFCLIYCNQSIAASRLDYEINGLREPLLSQIRTQLTAQQKAGQIPDIIQNTLKAYGYFKARVRTTLLQQGNDEVVRYRITAGPVLRITQLDLRINGPGAADPEVKALIAHFPLRPGQPLETLAYNQAKQALFTTIEQQGYIAARLIDHVIEVDLKRYTANVILHFNTGPRFFFGDVRFTPTPFTEEFLRRYLSFQTGQPYATNQLLALQDALSSSNYFQQVSVDPVRERIQAQQVPVQVTLAVRKPKQYSVGLGYGTDTGPRLGLGLDWRYVNSSGHRFSTLLSVSPARSSLQALYTIPGAHPATDWYTLNAGVSQEHLPQNDSFIKQVGVAKVRGVGNWQRSYALNYQIEDYNFTGQPSQRAKLLLPGVSWTYTQADDVVYTRRGDRFKISVQGAAQQLLSSTTFLQAEAQGKSIHSPNADSRVILRGDLGYTAAADINNLPASLRFYAGGSQSIRSYDYQQLGPGRYLTVGSVEYQHRIIGNWSAAVFYDVGNACDRFPLQLQQAVGVGMVWRSPVGPMELTLGHSLEQSSGHAVLLQFMMGPDLG